MKAEKMILKIQRYFGFSKFMKTIDCMRILDPKYLFTSFLDKIEIIQMQGEKQNSYIKGKSSHNAREKKNELHWCSTLKVTFCFLRNPKGYSDEVALF